MPETVNSLAATTRDIAIGKENEGLNRFKLMSAGRSEFSSEMYGVLADDMRQVLGLENPPTPQFDSYTGESMEGRATEASVRLMLVAAVARLEEAHGLLPNEACFNPVTGERIPPSPPITLTLKNGEQITSPDYRALYKRYMMLGLN